MNVPGELAVMAEQVTARSIGGVCCAAAPIAAHIGAEMLRGGGNAFDAAVAAALAETVLLPPKCGFGGDLVAIVRRAGEAAPRALVAVGGAPVGLAEVARGGEWRDVGANSVGPPAAAVGYDTLASQGHFDRERHAAPAIALARHGFTWAAVCTRLAEQAAALVTEMHPEGCVYYPDGVPIAPGAPVRLPGLADVLDEWVRRGAELLAGPVGAAIVDAVQARGGVLTADDFRFAQAEWLDCATAPIAGRTVWTTPAPTHGPSLLDALGAAWSIGSEPAPAQLHAAVLAAITRRRDSLADPSGTSMVSAADAEGTVVVIVHSNSFPRFGSGIVVPAYSLTLANRAGRGFTPRDGHPNFPIAGRRPATTLHAWAVSDERGTPQFFGATPGGANQMPWNAQTVHRLLAGEHRPGVLVTSPLWEWLPDDDGLRLESGFADADMHALGSVALRVLRTHRWGCKSAQQVVRVAGADGVVEAAADPRTVGAAVAG